MFTTEEIISILTKDEENLADVKRFLEEFKGKLPYLAYSLAVYPRSSLDWMMKPGLDYKKLNEELLKIQKQMTAERETANAKAD